MTAATHTYGQGPCTHRDCGHRTGSVQGMQCADCGHYYPRARVVVGADSEPRCREGMGCNSRTFDRVPVAARQYFAGVHVDTRQHHPRITQVFTRTGWADDNQRVSVSYLRQLRRQGVTDVQLSASGHATDFAMRELVS